jgi:hypothetical protein
MKTVKILMLAIAFTFTGLVSANNDPNPTVAEVTNSISSEIGKLLKNPKFLVDKDITAQVKVVINEDNELVVLSVVSENEELEGYIKGRLNYQELSVKLETGQKTYVVPVRLTQEE